MAWEQVSLFPKANKSDIQLARSLLNRYTRMRKTVDSLSARNAIGGKERLVMEEYKRKTEAVEMAVSLIMDDNVRRVIEFRFIRGNTRWGTVKRFESITDRSVDRRIVRGIESVAETLKLVGII
ncbi:hypothetical protein [Paenibacillus maysiensis]|uniref:hypothetical protein n=1 Tax=Paenibacillus maysiensis TaxID=1155954 RepID=UPI0004701629|nr:hypothetical protein [Paenibacillus maysiensis]